MRWFAELRRDVREIAGRSGQGPAVEVRPARSLPYLIAIPLPVAGLLAMLVYAWGDWDIMAVATLVAGGAFLSGGLLGFLFGIPRSLAGAQGSEDDNSSGSIRPNTNLEQISDWLTKILVGVGLVQFTTLARHAGELVDFLGPPLGGPPRGESFAGATLVVYGISGFLTFYLITRIDLPLAFAHTDRETREYAAFVRVRSERATRELKSVELNVTGELTADDRQLRATVDRLGVIPETTGAPRILWVDDQPENNIRERDLMTTLGMNVTTCLSTEDALGLLKRSDRPFDVVISDMGRPPDDQAGYTLLDAMRHEGDTTPFVIYAGSGSKEHNALAKQRGAIGSTNRPQRLLDLVHLALERRSH